MCKHRQRHARQLKNPVAQGADLSELAGFGWDPSHICERCRTLVPVSAIMHCQGVTLTELSLWAPRGPAGAPYYIPTIPALICGIVPLGSHGGGGSL
jgi:hypothetical protein